MMYIDYLLYLNLLFLSFFIFSSGFFHILKVLLGLEFIVISVLMLIMFYSGYSNLMSLGLYFLIFSVCEAILGLSLMVMMVRYSGSEHMKLISLSKF